ncbi:MAG: hypothetical protein ACRBCJ_11315 [Hyphomicrobiaceae bacterium]
MHWELKQHERISLGWPKQWLMGLSMKKFTVVLSVFFLTVLTGVVQPQLANSQNGWQNVGGSHGGGVGAPSGTQPGTGQSGANDGGDQAGDGEQNVQPTPRRRWIPRPPAGPGCPYRERQLELIV